MYARHLKIYISLSVSSIGSYPVGPGPWRSIQHGTGGPLRIARYRHGLRQTEPVVQRVQVDRVGGAEGQGNNGLSDW